MTMQERYLRVPLLIYGPKIVAPARIERVASQVDIAPTVLDILGIRARRAFVGTSLVSPVPYPPFALLLHDQQYHFPVCPDGYERSIDETVSCFRYDGDLLWSDAGQSFDVRALEKSSLRVFGRGLVESNHGLISRNGIYRKTARGE